VDGSQIRLVVVGVHLDLVDGGDDGQPWQDGLQVRPAEVADADGPNVSFGEESLKGAVGVNRRIEVLRQWLVEQVEIHRVDPEFASTDFEGMERPVVAVVADPYLRLDEQLRPIDAAGSDRGANLGLVEVGGGGVDHAIADAQRLLDRGLGHLGWRLKHAEAQGGQVDSGY
jgi:hypothetical protein